MAKLKSSIMYLSWEIQATYKFDRSRSLLYAWALYLTETIAVRRLVRKHAPGRTRTEVNPANLSLFNASTFNN